MVHELGSRAARAIPFFVWHRATSYTHFTPGVGTHHDEDETYEQHARDQLPSR